MDVQLLWDFYLTLPYTDLILHQVTQPVPQTGGAVGGTVPQTGCSVVLPIPQAGGSVVLPVSQTGNAVVQQIPQTVVQQIPQRVVQQIPQTGGAVGGIVGMATGGAIPRPGNPFYHQYQQTPAHHQIPVNQQRTSPINYLPEIDHPERILSSTPTGQAPPISTIPPLTPYLRTPPGI